MSWVAVAIAGGAVVGGVASNMSSRAANKPRTGNVESTTTQSPYMHGEIAPGLEDIINIQRGLVDRGAPIVNRDGTISYAALPNHTPLEGYEQQPPGPSGGNDSRGTSPGPRKPPSKTWVNAKGKTMTMGPNGKPVVATGSAARSGGAGTSTATPSAEDIFRQAAQRGFDVGDTPLQGQARTAMGNILGEAGGGGPETTGFEGYNPILDRLAGTLEGDVSSRKGRDLLLQFLDENNRGGGGTGGGSTTPRPGGGHGGTGTIVSYGTTGRPQAPSQPQFTGVPDTMVPDSYFGTETRKLMDEQANQTELEDAIRLMNEDVEKGMFRDLAQLDAAAQGTGRFGGSMFAGMSRDAREEALQEMAKNASQVRMGDREARRQARLAALSGVNTRDLGLLNANVQREAIAAGERNASAAAGAGAGAAADQIALAKRGQDLSALGALLDYEQGGVGQLSDIGSQLSSDRLNTLGLVPGLEGIGIQGLNVALGGGQGLADIRANAANAANARAGINLQRQGQAQQLAMFNSGQSQGLVNDYLNSLRGIGGLGGTNITRGINTQPGAGQSVWGQTLTGALGGASSGAGLAGMLSDELLKANIVAIGEVGGIHVAEWDWVDNNPYGLQGHTTGVIAQDVVQVLPDAVWANDDGYLVVDYAQVYSYMEAAQS